MNKNNKTKITNSIKYSEVSEDSSDDELGRTTTNNNKIKSGKKPLKTKNNTLEVTSAMSRGDSPRSVSSSTNHSML